MPSPPRVESRPRLGSDGRLHPPCVIACCWVDAEHGLEIEAEDLAPAPKGSEHKAHRISVYNGLLVCDCMNYVYSHWEPSRPKECKHLTGVDGLDGVAGWLETQAKRRDLSFRQRAIVSASHGDPHRAYVRAERTRRQLMADLATEAQPEPPDGHKRASAARGHKLEQFFQ